MNKKSPKVIQTSLEIADYNVLVQLISNKNIELCFIKKMSNSKPRHLRGIISAKGHATKH